MSINKSQGQTLSKVGLYLKNHVFAHGQLYVALSRVSSAENICVYIFQNDIEPKHGFSNGKWYTKNLVYQQLLQEEITLYKTSTT